MILFYFILISSVVHASWFSSEPEYAKWSDTELRTWLEHHNIKVPLSFDQPHLYDLVDANWDTAPSVLSAYAEAGRQWSLDQYNRAQRAFEHIRDDSFDKWEESKLRAFLLGQGVVAPSGPREQLVLLAKHKYRAYTDAAALYSSLASASAPPAYAGATDTAHSASQYISSAVAQATHEVTRAIDDSKDYVYSSWDDNRLKNWLEEHGVIEARNANTKDDLTRLAKDYYRKATSAAWESWSDSYIREWLIAHNLMKTTDTSPRSSLIGEMKKYYYSCTDNVWHTWSDSELKAWLVDHGFLKSDVERSREELVKAVEEHYSSALDNIWGAWSDSDIRQWLSERRYLEGRNDVNNRRDLVDLINSKYPNDSVMVAPYLIWPDARLRAYLRERGIGEKVLPTSRPGLLQETRIRWVQVSTRAETIFARLKEIINSSVEAAEEKVARILEILSGHSRDAARSASEKVDDARECADIKKAQAWSWGSHKADQTRGRAEEARRFAQQEGYEAVKRVGEGVDWGREKVQGAADEL